MESRGISTGDAILELSHLYAAIFFVIGLKKLSHRESARQGKRICSY